MSTFCRLPCLATTIAALAIALVSASSAGAAVAPTDPYQWDFHSSAPEANTYDADYAIANVRTTGGTYDNDGHLDLIAHNRTFGVGLDWGDGTHVSTGLRHWSFRRRSGATGPIGPSERVALYDNFTHRYLAEGGEHFGIDLAFTSSPVYDWQITVRSTGVGTLYNTDAGDYLVYNPRAIGVELMWLREVAGQNGVSLVANRSGAVPVTPQAPENGSIPYVGTLGGGPTTYNERLLSVTMPTWGIGLLTQGHTGADCATAGDVLWLERGATLTANQMVAVFGSTSPAFPVAFNACDPEQPGVPVPKSLAIGITYHGLMNQPSGANPFLARKLPGVGVGVGPVAALSTPQARTSGR